LKNTVTFKTLAFRLTGEKIAKKRRAKREWSPEEKKAFHERMLTGRQANEKSRLEAAKTEAKKK
jgi:hypothetical protein